ncbi:hypothetical protein D3C76_1289940 [compost metagenome]
MDPRCNFYRIERPCGQIIVHPGCSAEPGILFISNCSVPGVYCCLQLIGRNLHRFSQRLDRVALDDKAHFFILLNGFDAGLHAGIEYQIGCFFRQAVDGCCYFITGVQFIGEPCAFI